MAAASTWGFSQTGVPPPPDHAKARAFREASCPRQLRELSIYNFGEHTDNFNEGRLVLTKQCDEMFHKLCLLHSIIILTADQLCIGILYCF